MAGPAGVPIDEVLAQLDAIQLSGAGSPLACFAKSADRPVFPEAVNTPAAARAWLDRVYDWWKLPEGTFYTEHLCKCFSVPYAPLLTFHRADLHDQYTRRLFEFTRFYEFFHGVLHADNEGRATTADEEKCIFIFQTIHHGHRALQHLLQFMALNDPNRRMEAAPTHVTSFMDSRPITFGDLSIEKTPLAKIVGALFEMVRGQYLRKSPSPPVFIFRPRRHPERKFLIPAWEPIPSEAYDKQNMGLTEFVSSHFPKEIFLDLWATMLSRGCSVATIVTYLEKSTDWELAPLVRDRHLFAFHNGLLDVLKLQFRPYDPASVAVETVGASKFFPGNFEPFWMPMSEGKVPVPDNLDEETRIALEHYWGAERDGDRLAWRFIPTPIFDRVVKFQFPSEPDDIHLPTHKCFQVRTRDGFIETGHGKKPCTWDDIAAVGYNFSTCDKKLYITMRPRLARVCCAGLKGTMDSETLMYVVDLQSSGTPDALKKFDIARRNGIQPWIDAERKAYDESPMAIQLWLYVMMGRMLFSVNELDHWQVMLFVHGVPASGKSTICDVVAGFYSPEDVGEVATNIETVFGLAPIFNKKIGVAHDINEKLQIEQTVFQEIISGETVSVAVKNKDPIQGAWQPPLAFFSNRMLSYLDTGGNVARRMFMFEFQRQVRDQDGSIKAKVLGDAASSGEMHRLLIKCALAYHEVASRPIMVGGKLLRGGDANIWNIAPKHFKDNYEHVAESHSPLRAFIRERVVFDKANAGAVGNKVTEHELMAAFKNYCMAEGLKTMALNRDVVSQTLMQMGECVTRVVDRAQRRITHYYYGMKLLAVDEPPTSAGPA